MSKYLFILVALVCLGGAWPLRGQEITSPKLEQLKKGLQKEKEGVNKLRQQLLDKITSLSAMMKDFDDAAASMNGLSGLGRVEQLQFKAERYAAERQVRKQIEKEVLAIAALATELENSQTRVDEWDQLLELERKEIEVRISNNAASMAMQAANTQKEEKPATADQRNVEYYTVKKSADLKQISALPEVYGNANSWKYLFDANRDKIASPTSMIPAGSTLIVPVIKTEKAFINME